MRSDPKRDAITLYKYGLLERHPIKLLEVNDMTNEQLRDMVDYFTAQGDIEKADYYSNKLAQAESAAQAEAQAEESGSGAVAIEYISFGKIDSELEDEYNPYRSLSQDVDVVGVRITGDTARFRAEFSLTQLFPGGTETWNRIGEVTGENVRCRIIFQVSKDTMPKASWDELVEFQKELIRVKVLVKRSVLVETGLDPESDEAEELIEEALKEVFPNPLRFRPPTGGIGGVGFRTLRLTGLFQIELNSVKRDGVESRLFWMATNSAYDESDLVVTYGGGGTVANNLGKGGRTGVGSLPTKQNKVETNKGRN